jgi:thiamine pyrophosphate-dependent acetolactate synthase large subunit-like protein
LGVLLGSKVFMESLKREEVEYIFGLPGSSNLLFLDALEDCPEIKYILGLHEVVAIGMAEGYARISGKVGVVSLHNIAGLTAAMPLLCNVYLNKVPMVIIAGYSPRISLKKPQLPCRQLDLSRHLTKWSAEITQTSDIPLIMRDAFKMAKQAPAGPVFISLNENALSGSTEIKDSKKLKVSRHKGIKREDGEKTPGIPLKVIDSFNLRFDTTSQSEDQAGPDASHFLHELKYRIKPNLISVMLHELHKQVKPDTIIVEESPSYSTDVRRYLSSQGPLNYIHGHIEGSIGYGLPNALGAKLAAPDRPVIAIVGDGGAVWSIQSLWTAAHYHLAVTFIITANSSYRVLKLKKVASMGRKVKGRYLGLDLNQPTLSFCQMAQSMGVSAAKVKLPDEISESLKLALSMGSPYLLEVDLKENP